VSRNAATTHDFFLMAVQESLGGNAKTMLICNISPAVAFAEETQITLEFARGAKELKNRVCTATSHCISLVLTDSRLRRHSKLTSCCCPERCAHGYHAFAV
jgi:Kinesin motor domain